MEINTHVEDEFWINERDSPIIVITDGIEVENNDNDSKEDGNDDMNEDSSLISSNGNNIGDGDPPSDVPPCDYYESLTQDEIDAILNANLEFAERYNEELKRRIDNQRSEFNKNNPRTYDKAKELYTRSMRNPDYGLNAKDRVAIQSMLEIQELGRIQAELSTLAKVGKAYFHINDIVNLATALRNGDFDGAFDIAVSGGVSVAIGRLTSLLAPVSLPIIIGISVLNAVLSYFFDEEFIREQRENLQNSFQNINNSINTETGCAIK